MESLTARLLRNMDEEHLQRIRLRVPEILGPLSQPRFGAMLLRQPLLLQGLCDFLVRVDLHKAPVPSFDPRVDLDHIRSRGVDLL
ncbi:MAG: hypothetical protein NBKEAIPA_01268 [Nitrospirae bacterium]|nr:hypothetical protein [Nitrospirota bacterium]